MVKVVVVEDEPLTRRALALGLVRDGFEVVEAAGAAACRAALRAQVVDAVVLDLGLPDGDGMDLAAELRIDENVGLVVVTRRGEPESRIRALDLGADDYLVKPVHAGELSARIRSVLRRRKPNRPARRRLGPWLIDMEARTVMTVGAEARLTRGEFDVLALLIAAEGGIVRRDALIKAISRRPDVVDPRSVDVVVSRLRRKLAAAEGEIILTAPGFGYQLSAPAMPV